MKQKAGFYDAFARALAGVWFSTGLGTQSVRKLRANNSQTDVATPRQMRTLNSTFGASPNERTVRGDTFPIISS